MMAQEASENTVVVDLPPEPAAAEEIQRVTGVVGDRGDCDVAMDMSGVDILRSTSLAGLLRLHKLLRSCGHRLILCGLAPATRGILEVTGLVKVFEILDSKVGAVAALQMDPPSHVPGPTGQVCGGSKGTLRRGRD